MATSEVEVLPGDFFSLLARHRLAPVPSAAGGAPTETQATTVFGFHWAEGIMMAGDRRATAGNLIVTQEVDKILELDASSLLAIAGVPAMAFEMARVLQTSFEYYRRSQLQALSLPAKVRALARLLRENIPMTLQGVGIVVPLFAGIDVAVSPVVPRLFFYDPLGAQFQAAGFAASGSGAASVKSILSFQEQFGDPRPSQMGLPQAAQFALRLLKVSAEFDAATGGVDPPAGLFATLKVLRPGGVETISPEQQTEFLSA